MFNDKCWLSPNVTLPVTLYSGFILSTSPTTSTIFSHVAFLISSVISLESVKLVTSILLSFLAIYLVSSQTIIVLTFPFESVLI